MPGAQSPDIYILCSVGHQHEQGTDVPGKGQERSGRLCQKDLHDLEREEAEQSASKKRRADISSFSIAAQLSCDDLSRAGTETEGAEAASDQNMEDACLNHAVIGDIPHECC